MIDVILSLVLNILRFILAFLLSNHSCLYASVAVFIMSSGASQYDVMIVGEQAYSKPELLHSYHHATKVVCCKSCDAKRIWYGVDIS